MSFHLRRSEVLRFNPVSTVVLTAPGCHQVWVGVMPTGPNGRALNSSYRSRETCEYKLELGLAIFNLARVVPDGMLVFFPSYTVLSACIEAWQSCTDLTMPSIWCVAAPAAS